MWITLALGSVVLWSLVNISDSYMVRLNKGIGHPVGSLVIFSGLFGFVTAGLIALFIGESLALSFQNLGLVFIAGFCNLAWIVLYLNALPDEDVSSVVPWFLTTPLFTYILGYLLLRETLDIQQILGGIIMIIGGLVLSVRSYTQETTEKKIYKIRWKPILLMTGASALIAIWTVLFKVVAQESSFWVTSFWEHIGLGIAGIIILLVMKSYREGFGTLLKRNGKTIVSINLVSESATIIGNLLSNYAILLVPVSLVTLLHVSLPAMVFILGILGTLFVPRIISEDISTKNLLHKGVSIGIMILGAIVLSIP